MRIFVYLKNGEMVLRDDATGVVSSKGNIGLVDSRGVYLFTVKKEDVTQIQILPQLWEL